MKHEIKPLVPVSTEGLEETARALLEGKPEESDESSQGAPFHTNAQIELSDYVQVGIKGLFGNPVLISKFELPGHNNLNYEKTHFKVFENGLYMPTPAIFMKYFINVINAYNKNIPIYDGNGNRINSIELGDIYKHLTTNHIASYGEPDKAGAWTWLNAGFSKENEQWKIKYATGISNVQKGTIKKTSRKKLEFKEENLESCLMNDCFVNLDFNSQGLAITPYSKQSYEQGKNIRFLHPRNKAVAGFYDDSDWACLDCYRDPGDTDASLGVFGCCEAAQKI